MIKGLGRDGTQLPYGQHKITKTAPLRGLLCKEATTLLGKGKSIWGVKNKPSADFFKIFYSAHYHEYNLFQKAHLHEKHYFLNTIFVFTDDETRETQN